MWTPAERIKYKPEPGPSPSADEAGRSKWFNPVRLGAVTVPQRTWVPAMVPWRATEEGFVTDEVLDWYERFARGRPGVIVVEATGIRDIPSGPLLRIADDRFIPGLKELVEVVRRGSNGQTKLLIQLIDFLSIRRRPQPEKYFKKFLQLNDKYIKIIENNDWDETQFRDYLAKLNEAELEKILDARDLEDLRMGYRERVTDMHLPQVRELPQILPDLFSSAAQRAEAAGFDGVELHYAHAYTMASFLSATNDRSDGYGGVRENRVRLPLEVYRQVRQAVSKQFIVGCRYLSEECFDGGNCLEDTTYFGVEFARAGMDFLSLSRGGKFDDAKQPKIGWAAYPYTGRSGYECMPGYISDQKGPFGRNVHAVAEIRRAVRDAGFDTPVVVCGGIHGFKQAEEILNNEQADIVGAARQSLADPDWFLKIRQGHGDEVRVCEYTNYCEGLDQKHKQVTCQLWDRLDRDEPDVKMSRDGKRRLLAPLWKQSGQ